MMTWKDKQNVKLFVELFVSWKFETYHFYLAACSNFLDQKYSYNIFNTLNNCFIW